jgi:acyl carrier protein
MARVIMTEELQASLQSKESIEEWLTNWISNAVALPRSSVDPRKSLLDYSLSSVTATMLVGDLEDWLGLTLAPTLAWDYPSINAMTEHLVEQLAAEHGATADGASRSHLGGGQGVGAIDPSDAEDLLSNLDGLSDQDVNAILNQLLVDKTSNAAAQQD